MDDILLLKILNDSNVTLHVFVIKIVSIGKLPRNANFNNSAGEYKILYTDIHNVKYMGKIHDFGEDSIQRPKWFGVGKIYDIVKNEEEFSAKYPHIAFRDSNVIYFDDF